MSETSSIAEDQGPQKPFLPSTTTPLVIDSKACASKRKANTEACRKYRQRKRASEITQKQRDHYRTERDFYKDVVKENGIITRSRPSTPTM